MNAEPIPAGSWDRIIRPRKGLVPVDFRELWRYRELLLTLATRNILIRYKQTLIGILWAVIQPVVSMVIFTVVFGRLGRFPSNGAPYAVMTLAAILPWQFFSEALSRGSASVVGAQDMVQKVYFPRLYIPASQVMAAVVDFLISFVILVAMMLWFRLPLRAELLLLPVFFAVAFAAALGLALLFGALNVKYRDVGHAVPFLIRIGMYISPVGFMSSIVPEKWRLLYSLNPVVGVIDGFRWAVLGNRFEPYWPGFWASLAVVTVVFILGLYYFRYTEKTFADVI
jgi:lipopolysaccharide transport system permease protein